MFPRDFHLISCLLAEKNGCDRMKKTLLALIVIVIFAEEAIKFDDAMKNRQLEDSAAGKNLVDEATDLVRLDDFTLYSNFIKPESSSIAGEEIVEKKKKKRKSTSETLYEQYSDSEHLEIIEDDPADRKPAPERENTSKPSPSSASSLMTWTTKNPLSNSGSTKTGTNGQTTIISNRVITVYPTILRPNLQSDSLSLVPKLAIVILLAIISVAIFL